MHVVNKFLKVKCVNNLTHKPMVQCDRNCHTIFSIDNLAGSKEKDNAFIFHMAFPQYKPACEHFTIFSDFLVSRFQSFSSFLTKTHINIFLQDTGVKLIWKGL